MSFTPTLFAWWATHSRTLPWKNTRDPYAIWLSEIILQQTRVEQGLPYYLRFMAEFPTVRHLADAPADEVMRLWQGLGYYSRARNLHHTAQHIANDLNGMFPTTYEGIRQLRGVGDYTAAAIASFAFGLPYAVVDGNVYRVLSRIFGIDTPTDTTSGKRQFADIAQQLLPPDRPADFNQAMMDFGATCCTPAQPRCSSCPLQTQCQAYQTNRVGQLPIKSKKITRHERYLSYLVICNSANDQVLIRQRTDKDIWQTLYEFPMIETTDRLPTVGEIIEHPLWRKWLGDTEAAITAISATYSQTLTHRQVVAQFCEVTLSNLTHCQLPIGTMVSWQAIDSYAFPKVIRDYRQNRHV